MIICDRCKKSPASARTSGNDMCDRCFADYSDLLSKFFANATAIKVDVVIAADVVAADQVDQTTITILDIKL